MGQLIRLLIIILVSSGLYTFWCGLNNVPKTNKGYFVMAIICVFGWLIIKNIYKEVRG